MTRASRPLAPRTLAWALLVLTLGLGVGSVSSADASGEGRASGRIELVGDAALIDSNVGNFSSKHYFNAVVRVANSIPRTENLTVEFVVKQGSRVVATAQETAGIRRGGGVVMKQLLLERKGRYRVSARFVHFEEAADPDPLATLEVGSPKFIHNGSPFCSMTGHVTNPSGEKVEGDVLPGRPARWQDRCRSAHIGAVLRARRRPVCGPEGRPHHVCEDGSGAGVRRGQRRLNRVRSTAAPAPSA